PPQQPTVADSGNRRGSLPPRPRSRGLQGLGACLAGRVWRAARSRPGAHRPERLPDLWPAALAADPRRPHRYAPRGGAARWPQPALTFATSTPSLATWWPASWPSPTRWRWWRICARRYGGCGAWSSISPTG